MATALDFRPDNVPLQLYAGDDETLELELLEDDGTPYDLTGASVAAQIRSVDGTLQTDLTVDVEANVITLTVPHTATVADKSRWDCQVTTAGGTVTTIAGGWVRVTPDVTP